MNILGDALLKKVISIYSYEVRLMAIYVYGRIKRRCIDEDLLEGILVDFFHLKVILSEKIMKSV